MIMVNLDSYTLMQGFYCRGNRDRNFIFAEEMTANSIFVDFIKHVAEMSGDLKVYFGYGTDFIGNRTITISYVPQVSRSFEIWMPCIQKSIDSFDTFSIEEAGYANSIEEYIKFMPGAIVCSIEKGLTPTKLRQKMFNGASKEELEIFLDLYNV